MNLPEGFPQAVVVARGVELKPATGTKVAGEVQPVMLARELTQEEVAVPTRKVHLPQSNVGVVVSLTAREIDANECGWDCYDCHSPRARTRTSNLRVVALCVVASTFLSVEVPALPAACGSESGLYTPKHQFLHTWPDTPLPGALPIELPWDSQYNTPIEACQP